jgi:hypothetical protein
MTAPAIDPEKEQRWRYGGTCQCPNCIIKRWNARNRVAKERGRPLEPKPPFQDRRLLKYKSLPQCECKLCVSRRKSSKTAGEARRPRTAQSALDRKALAMLQREGFR